MGILLDDIRICPFFAAFHRSLCSGKEPFRIVDTDILSCFLTELFQENIIPMIDDPDFMEVPDNIRSYEYSRGEPLGKLYPFRIRGPVFADDLVENDPGIIDMEVRILEQEPFDHLLIEWRIDPTGDSAVAKYHLHAREFP